MLSNLPPGVTESMIPGNSPEDAWWDQVVDNLPEEIVAVIADPSHPLYDDVESYMDNFDSDSNIHDVVSKITEHFYRLKRDDE